MGRRGRISVVDPDPDDTCVFERLGSGSANIFCTDPDLAPNPDSSINKQKK